MAQNREMNLELVLSARNETRKAFDSVKEQMQGIAKTAAGIFGVSAGLTTVVKAAGAIGGVMTGLQTQMRWLNEEGIAGWLWGQVEVNRKYADLAGSLPLVGEGLRKIVEAGQHNQDLLDAAAAIKRMADEAARYVTSLQNMGKEAAQLKLQALDLSPFEAARMEGAMGVEARNAALEKAAKEGEEADRKARNLRNAWKSIVGEAGILSVEMAKPHVEALYHMMDEAEQNADRMQDAWQEAKTAVADANAAQQTINENNARKEEDRRKENMRQAIAAFKEEEEAKHRAFVEGLRRRDAAEAEAQQRRDNLARLVDDRRREAAELENDIFAASHSQREIMIRQIGQEMDKLRAQYKGDPEMQALIEQARKAKLGAVPAEQQAAGGPIDVQARQSRFLTTVPGREYPTWARDLRDRSGTQIELLRDISRKLPIVISTEMN